MSTRVWWFMIAAFTAGVYVGVASVGILNWYVQGQ
jgi:hypothetical protein